MTALTFIGLGTMGAPMVRRLTGAGHTVAISDVNVEAANTLAAETGANVALRAQDAPAPEVVVLMLPNSAIVQSVLGENDDPASFVRALRPGTIVVDMSSSKPDATQANAVRLAALGLHLVDAPVSGGPVKAATGELSIMVGGDDDDFARVRPVLETMGTAIRRTGPVGSAHALKALNNLLSVIGIVGALEVLAVGKRFGLEPQVMLDVINASTGRNQATEMKIGQQVLTRKWNVGFSLALTVKDVDTALDLAAAQGIRVPVSEAAVEVTRGALELLSGSNPDQSQIAEYIESANGFRYDESATE